MDLKRSRSSMAARLELLLALIIVATIDPLHDVYINRVKLCSAASITYKPLTVGQWVDRFTCDSVNATTTTTTTNQSDARDCQRHDPSRPDYCHKEEAVCSARASIDWVWNYVDELEPEFRLLIKEKSIDERLANIIYATVTTRTFDPDVYGLFGQDAVHRERAERLLIGSQVNETLCGLQLEQMLQLTDQFAAHLEKQRHQPEASQAELDERYIRLARALDSYGRYGSGFLSGRYQSFGSYEQCINTQLKMESDASDEPLVGMRYCWANLDLVPNLSGELRYSKSATKVRSNERGKTQVAVGICLPESCHSNSLVKHHQSIQRLFDGQFRFPSGIYRNETLRVAYLSCVADEKSPIGIPTGGKIVLAVLGGWTLLVMYATYRNTHTDNVDCDNTNIKDELPETSSSKSWLSCLSLTDSWNEFVESKETHQQFADGRISLDPLNPMKFLACLMFALGHALIIQTGISSGLLRDIKLMETDPLLQVTFVAPMVVESFFVLSGLLITYIALKKDTAHQTLASKDTSPLFELSNFILKCTKLIVSRFLRVYPMLYLVFAFKKGVFTFLGSGPNWNYGLNGNGMRQCQDHSWLSPFMLGSFVYAKMFDRDCLPQTYTVACDLVFVVLIAPFVYLINKWPRPIIGLALVGTLASNTAGLVAYDNVDKSIVWPISQLRSYNIYQLFSSGVGLIYMTPDYRLGSIFFGMIAGYVVFKYEQSNEIEHQCCPRWLLTGLTWFASLYPMGICFASAFKAPMRTDATWLMRALAPHFFITLRLLWALSTAVLCVRLITDWNHTKNIAWMKSKTWKILAKLNYAILLVHLDLFYLDWHLQTNELYLSKYNVLKTFTFVYVTSVAVGALLYVLVENPINKLVKKALAKFA